MAVIFTTLLGCAPDAPRISEYSFPGDTSDTHGPYQVSAHIRGAVDTVVAFAETDESAYAPRLLNTLGDGRYSVALPPAPAGTRVSVWIEVRGPGGRDRAPRDGPHIFTVRPRGGACRFDGACARGEYCDTREGRCRTPPDVCQTDADCPQDYECSSPGAPCRFRPDPCVGDADCPRGAVCESGRCVAAPACRHDAECPDGSHCVEGICERDCICPDGTPCDPDGACTLVCVCPDGSPCGPDGACEPACTCPDGTPCDPDGTCEPVPECRQDADCPPGMECLRGACQPAPECRVDAECPPSHACQDGFCQPVCDCAPGTACQDRVCVPDGCADLCLDGTVCDPVLGACVPVDADCAADSLGDNHRPETATRLGGGADIRARLCPGQDDWFSIRAAAAGPNRVVVQPGGDGLYVWSRRDEEGTVIDSGPRRDELYLPLLDGERTLLSLSCLECASSGLNYHLQVHGALGNDECRPDRFDPRESREAAIRLPVPSRTEALRVCPRRPDWHLVAWDDPRPLSITAAALSGAAPLQIDVFAELGAFRAEASGRGRVNLILPADLVRGGYYIQISTTDPAVEYTLHLDL